MTSLNPYLRVGTQLAEVLVRHRGMEDRAARRAAMEMLERVRIPDARQRAGRYPHELSGGMRQCVMVSMALLCEPALPRAERRQRVAKTLNLVGLGAGSTERHPHELSGGQCQRVGIARAMILHPRLIVADEPVLALDVSIQAQIVNLLMALQQEFGLSLLFISHNLGVVCHISRRILVLYLGKVMEVGEADDLCERPLHPYSQALLEAAPVPDPAIERAKPRPTLTGEVPSPLAPPSGCRFRTRCPKATGLCAEVEPPLRELGHGRFAACHYADG